jgi:hypothetical protein
VKGKERKGKETWVSVWFVKISVLCRFFGKLSLHDPGDHVSLRLSKADRGGPGLKNGFRVRLDDHGVPDAGVFGTGVERCSAGAGVEL